VISAIPTTSPRSLTEAYAVLSQGHRGLRVLAGGTDLMVQVNARAGLDRIGHVLDIWRVEELRGIVAGSALRIGALTTFAEIITSPLVAKTFPALVEVSREVGAWAIQNRGTLGGNVCNASPAGDTLPILLAADARFRVGGPRGEREVPADRFFVGYRKTDLAADELLLSIDLPPPPQGARLLYRKVGTRRAQAISKVILALRASWSGSAFGAVRVAAGCMAPTPRRCPQTEVALEGHGLGEAAVRAALGRDLTPIDDLRSTAGYRQKVVGNVAVRLLRNLAGLD
jgi:CO/xanthine dehydrogenase FAD-binding subunit